MDVYQKLTKEKILIMGGMEFKLELISKDELLKRRLENTPGVIFKQNGELWYTELPNKDIKFNTEESKNIFHECRLATVCCKRLSANEDPKGCAFVRDESLSGVRKKTIEIVLSSVRIEKYPFIKSAIETINLKWNYFKIIECEHSCRERVIPIKVDG